ncbi:GNAT family N-acetyltransferase [Streptomyces rectiverticillatus]|uniref:GNAT family N-acetyltransferase n=1 Tax=Streptomyces rectiverticillatus TaxID=173860 RepID=UPI0015C2F7B6|nr:GNAT family N-acetyltransferase [Streptomyces rectiverticillatus]QLE75589.1 GNAT family N-acetyltransferase [Streptomyces rectiverticillatus]
MLRLRTDRLVLRAWQESDLDPWAAMNADPEVRRYFPAVLTREESEASVACFQADLERRGWGWWAVEVVATGEFIGFAGLDPVEEDMPFTGVEAGWRLARPAWGHGYATEAALAVVEYGFGDLGLTEILAVTTATNLRSQAVMRRIGMTYDPADDFDDLTVPEGPLRKNVVYRLRVGDRPRTASWTGQTGRAGG